jgi:hypothetical protein
MDGARFCAVGQQSPSCVFAPLYGLDVSRMTAIYVKFPEVLVKSFR